MNSSSPTDTHSTLSHPRASTGLWAGTWSLPIAFAVAKLLIHLPLLHRFGIHHDELYFLACGRHLDLGYVDHPPFVPLLARISEELFGHSLVALRMWGVVAGMVTIVLVLRLVQRLGGGTFAQVAVGLSYFAAPVFLRVHQMMNIPTWEPLIWLGVAHLLLSIFEQDRPRLWLAVGALCGAGLWIKHSILFLGFGLVVALLLTPHRRQLRERWIWAGGAIAVAFFLPNLWWQATHGWPTVTFLRTLNDDVMSGIGPVQFTLGQFLYLNPVTAPLWLAGLVAGLRAGKSDPRRVFAWIYLAVFALLVTVGSKIYYLAPAYPMLFAVGAVRIEAWIAAREGRRWLRPTTAGALLVGAAAMMPLSLPMLSIDRTETFIDAITFHSFENVYELTADLRGQFGWRERAEGVAAVWHDLSDAEREHAVLVGDWYGPAGAIDYWGPDLGLPSAYSTHLSYHLWATPPADTELYVLAGENPEDARRFFDQVEVVLTVVVPESNPWDRTFHISLARGPVAPVEEIWPELREY